MTTLPENARLAVLVDADNTSVKRVSLLLEEVTKYGSATVRRAYADWSSERVGRWKDQLNQHAIQPIQQFAYTTGKNATDFALVIDAMDLLYAGNVDGFVLVSSDSDFTRLATRLRESGKYVLGMGERKTPQALRAACDRFVYLDLLGEEAPDEVPAGQAPSRERGDEAGNQPPPLRRPLSSAIETTSQDDGWSSLGAVGTILVQNDPSFDPRLYGHSKLSNLVRAQPYVEVRSPQSGTGTSVWVRLRQEAPAKKSAGQPAKKSAGQPAKKSAGQPAKKSARKPAKRSAGQPAKESAATESAATESAAKESAGQPARNAAQASG